MTLLLSGAIRVYGDSAGVASPSLIEHFVPQCDVGVPARATVVLSSEALQNALPGIVPGALLVVSADDGQLMQSVAATGLQHVSVGYSSDADFSASDIDTTLQGTAFVLRAHDSTHFVTIPVPGEHLVTAALLAIAIAASRGIPVDAAVRALSTTAMAGFGIMDIQTRADGAVVIDDSASLSMGSTMGALKTLAIVSRDRSRAIAVLADLDDAAEPDGGTTPEIAARERREAIGRLVVRLNVRLLVVVGERARLIHAAAGLEGSWDGEAVIVADAEQALTVVQSQLGAGDVVLVKCEQSIGASSIADRLLSPSSETAGML